MPEGRILKKKTADDERLGSVPIEAECLYLLMIPWLDKEGRHKGEPKALNGKFFSLRDYTSEQVQEWLEALATQKSPRTGLGLIELYKVGSQQFIWVPGFEGEQSSNWRTSTKLVEAESTLPPPPGDLMEKARQSMVEYRGKELEKPNDQIRTDDLKVATMIKTYEDELGRPLTPHDLDILIDFADNYPDGWFDKAVAEAVNNNANAPMSYIQKVMENWLANERERPSTHSKDTRESRVKKLKESAGK